MKKRRESTCLKTNAKIVKKSIYRWSKVDMSIDAQKSCLAQRERKTTLSEEKKRAVKEFITFQAENAVPTSAKDIISFIFHSFEWLFLPNKGIYFKTLQKIKS